MCIRDRGGEELTEAEIKGALRQRVLNNEIILVTCGSAFKNKGVQAMLDAVIDYLPSPVDVPAINGILAVSYTHLDVYKRQP